MAGIRNACKRFVGLCRELKLFTQAMVAIDGSKFKAVNRRERELEENIQRYLDALETADRTQPVELQSKTERLQDKITKLRQKMKDLQEIKTQLQAQPDGQLSLTDPDARAMPTHSMKGTAMVGYNVQTVVDAQHHLIVAHDVTNSGSDRAQLSKMALAAREAIGAPDLQALADRGYFNSLEIKACDEKLPPMSTRNWPNAGTRVHDLVTRKLTIALYQPMPGLEEPDRERLLPVRVFRSPPTRSSADHQN